MLFWLCGPAGELSAFNVFRYITFRTGGALITALLFVFLFGPMIIGRSASARARASRSARTAPSAICSKEGHAHHGRADDPVGR